MSDCIPWEGRIDSTGYGLMRVSPKKDRKAHRALWEQAFGPLPQGLELDHICHNQDLTCAGGKSCMHRRCVNFEHLEPVTRRTNLLRGRTIPAANAAKTECLHGHPFDAVNTYITPQGRSCRTCMREREKNRKPRDPEALRAYQREWARRKALKDPSVSERSIARYQKLSQDPIWRAERNRKQRERRASKKRSPVSVSSFGEEVEIG